MSTVGFVRKKRLAPPQIPGGEINLQAPPVLPRETAGSIIPKIMPFVMMVAMVGMVTMMFTSGSMNMSNPMSLMFPMMMLMSMVTMIANNANNSKGKSTEELNEERKDYLRYLDGMREKITDIESQQRLALEWNNPDPRSLSNYFGNRRMWERRTADKDFGYVRLGLGNQRLAARIIPPETGPLEELEPVSAAGLRRFVKAHAVVHNLPTSLALRAFSKVAMFGDKERINGLIRSMVMELATFHGPDDFRVVLITQNIENRDWGWLKWLPQAQHPVNQDGIGSMRSVYNSLAEFERDWEFDFNERGNFKRNAAVEDHPTVLVICDSGFVSGQERLLSPTGIEGVTFLDAGYLIENKNFRGDINLKVTEKDLLVDSLGKLDRFATPDYLSVLETQALAKQLAKYRNATAAQLIELTEAAGEVKDDGLLSLLHVGDAADIDPNVVWRKRSARERLRVPIGLDPNHRPVEIDIKEAAENGMGPHGLCIGATGSGKSEFLRTLVLSMLITHSPDALNLILVDFKGGATFLGLDSAPHVSAVITNLEDELDLVDRMQDALYGEMNRRQEILRDAGNFPNVTEYERARPNGADLDPLPALFIVVDEFSELLSQKPDFADLFVAIGRLGRSLHMHLLLASQRLEEGKLRGLDSHLSYRIGLKTFSANESRTVLGVPDAYHLPGEPGSGYLKSDASDLVRFKAAYVSGDYKPERSLTSKKAISNNLLQSPV